MSDIINLSCFTQNGLILKTFHSPHHAQLSDDVVGQIPKIAFEMLIQQGSKYLETTLHDLRITVMSKGPVAVCMTHSEPSEHLLIHLHLLCSVFLLKNKLDELLAYLPQYFTSMERNVTPTNPTFSDPKLASLLAQLDFGCFQKLLQLTVFNPYPVLPRQFAFVSLPSSGNGGVKEVVKQCGGF